MAFKILSATFLQDGKHSFTLDFSKPENEIQDTQFTLLIGKMVWARVSYWKPS